MLTVRSQFNSETMPVSKIIELTQQRFGHLYGGNCGTFALALCRILRDHGISSSVYLVIAPLDGENLTIHDISSQEPTVYHIYVKAKKEDVEYFMDGLKVYPNVSDVLVYFDNFIATEAGDINEFEFEFTTENEQQIRTLVEFDTNYSIGEDEFYTFMKNLTEDKNVVVN